MPGTGIGPALREARLSQGKSVEEASRETRIRTDYLQALEQEDYDELRGDVYVRGFLRTYSSYLGLNADHLLERYNREFGPPAPTVPAPLPGPARGPRIVNPHLFPFRSHHPTWAFLSAVALVVLGVFGAVGLFSGNPPAPAAALPPASPAPATSPPQVVVNIVADQTVAVRVLVDGRVAFDGQLVKGEGRSWTGAQRIQVSVARGGSVRLTVNGFSLGTPGRPGVPYAASFGPGDYRNRVHPSPSQGGTPSPHASA